MDLIATWGWPAWTIAVLVVVVVGRLLVRYLSALAFRYLQLGGLVRQYGWQVDLPGGDGGRAEFDERLRQQRRQGWAHLRQGWSGIREGYRSGVFGRPVSSGWNAELTITGAYRGRAFMASQARRFELRQQQGRAYRKARRRASLELRAQLPPFEARTGLLSGQVRGAPPGLEQLLASRRFRVIRSDGSSLSTQLGPRLRRGPLLAGLAHLSTVADQLGAR